MAIDSSRAALGVTIIKYFHVISPARGYQPIRSTSWTRSIDDGYETPEMMVLDLNTRMRGISAWVDSRDDRLGLSPAHVYVYVYVCQAVPDRKTIIDRTFIMYVLKKTIGRNNLEYGYFFPRHEYYYAAFLNSGHYLLKPRSSDTDTSYGRKSRARAYE